MKVLALLLLGILNAQTIQVVTSTQKKFFSATGPGIVTNSRSGDIFVNTATKNIYICANASSYCTAVGSANWVQITFTGSAGAIGISNGSSVIPKVIPDCINPTNSKLLFDAASQEFTCGTDQSSVGGSSGITSLNGVSGTTQVFATGTIGTDFNVVSSGVTHTFHFPTASATNRGLLSSTDWNTFNEKQSSIVGAPGTWPTFGTAALQNTNSFEVPLTFSAPLTRSTNTISLADPAPCSTGFVTDINANGTLTCSNPPSDPVAETAGLRTLGTGPQQAVAGDDSRLSDPRTPTDNSVSTTKLVDGAVTLSKLANIATARMLGRISAGTGSPEELTNSQIKTFLNIAPSDISSVNNLLTNATQTVTTGPTTTVGNRVRRVFVDPGSAITLVITLAAAPVDGDETFIYFGGTIANASVVCTTLTIAANAGHTLQEFSSPVNAVGGDRVAYQFSAATNRWYRLF